MFLRLREVGGGGNKRPGRLVAFVRCWERSTIGGREMGWVPGAGGFLVSAF